MARFILTVMVLTHTGLLWDAPVMAADLAPYLWKNRLLLVFAPSPSDRRFAVFEKSLVDASTDLQDRDLRVYRIFESGRSYLDGQALPPEDARALRRRFGLHTGEFRLILIGKDGGVKLTGDERVALQTVFGRIDQMPMRQQEMKSRGRSP